MTAQYLLEHLCPHGQAFPVHPITLVTEKASLAHESSLFVCIRGARFDGHELAAQAYGNGCRVFVAEHALALPEDAFVLRVPSTRRALAILACAFYGHPTQRMRIVGITGTKGKTTVAYMLTHILNAEGIPCGYIGTNGIFYPGTSRPTVNTTPDAITLQSTLREMLDAGVQTAVLEISSQALMQFRADGITFSAVLFTNLFHDHISPNEHASFEDYKACKQRLFGEFGAPLMICNGDDAAAPEMLEVAKNCRKIICSLQDPRADYVADGLRRYCDRSTVGNSFTVTHQAQNIPCRLPLLGGFNASNALLAMATAHQAFAVPLSRSAQHLSSIRVPGRGKLTALPNGAIAVIDYAHNGESLRSLLTSLREYRPSRLICLFGSVGERTQLRRRELGQVAAALCDLCILTSDNPGKEPPEEIIAEIAQAFAGTDTPYLSIPDRTHAIHTAVQMTQPGDILVLAGKGHETYQLIGEEQIPFSEKEILQDAIRQVSPI
ncbi:MAG: UDP-N-acetylmuramoyl-L-alanyl-D-glutamate--2,6-diaminopimelate ligase [Clostridia bacterium]|nr:UDP-N-acetylmuramoyl-L-alanyl-D-glutamate--2,6-diaminopimelate ligase [Clostridia bacterium]